MSSGSELDTKIKAATSAYAFFQRDSFHRIKAELVAAGKESDMGNIMREVAAQWQGLEDKSKYEALAAEDQFRFQEESRRRDELVLKEQERKRSERDCYVEEGSKRSSAMQASKVLTERAEKRAAYQSQPRQLTQKQIELKKQAQQEREEKEAYIAKKRAEVRKARAKQAKRRFEFLLKQSNIFSHFGDVKEEQMNLGANKLSNSTSDMRHSHRDANAQTDGENANEEDNEAESLTYLTSQPTTLGFGTMRAYQLEGLNWMIRLQDNGVNGILADEMGLGKTLQSISVLVYMQEYFKEAGADGPHIVVVPKSTLSNWLNEFKRWAPTLSVVQFHGNKEEREKISTEVLLPGLDDETRSWNVCLTTYEICNLEKSVLNKFAWSYLIIDEAHRLKNEASVFSQTVRSFETRFRLLLTGTPLQNNLHELWALLNFLVPDVFSSAEQFDEWFNLDIGDAEAKNKLISQLHKVLRPFMLRRLKADVEKSLPPKFETILYTGMSAMQKKIYRNILMRDIDTLQGQGANRSALLNIVMQLRKCAGHPYLFPGVEDRSLPPLGEHLVENCGKMVLLDKLLRRLKERGHRVLLFTQMTRILDILEDYLVMRGFEYCRIDGNTSYETREDSIDAFNAPDSKKFLFLLSTRAGGLGINLQTADTVVIYDSDWNPQADLQAQDRAHRIGQKKTVQVFRLVTEHTIEEKVVERAQQKLKLDAMVVQSGRLKDKDKLSSDELLASVRFGADKIFRSNDSSITDDDIDTILDSGRKKTEELNAKLKNAEKGDLLDFNMDVGESLQTFEGVDYSNQAYKSEMFGILDLGKRERSTVTNYNETNLFRQGQPPQQKKPKVKRLPKCFRLPKMEEWHMFDRDVLTEIQEEEEKEFRRLDEEDKLPEDCETSEGFPPLISTEREKQKGELLAQGFQSWNRHHYVNFVKASAKYGRKDIKAIATFIGKSIEDVALYAQAFWSENIGKQRISDHEYERVTKLIERGEKKLEEIKSMEGATAALISLFDNPWFELEFSHASCKDRMFTIEEDRHLLCWSHKYGHGNWHAIRFAIKRSGTFRFNYHLRSLSVEAIGRRCETLMRAAEREIEQLEKVYREDHGLPTAADDKGSLAKVQLPKVKIIKAEKRAIEEAEREKQKDVLIGKVEEIESQMEAIQGRLQELEKMDGNVTLSNDSMSDEALRNLVDFIARHGSGTSLSMAKDFITKSSGKLPSKHVIVQKIEEVAVKEQREEDGDTKKEWHIRDDFVHLIDVGTLRHVRKEREFRHQESAKKKAKRASEVLKRKRDNINNNEGEIFSSIKTEHETVVNLFSEYDGSELPKQWKKDFTLFCIANRKIVKSTLSDKDRGKKEKIHAALKHRWESLADDERDIWKDKEFQDKKRYAHEMEIYESQKSGDTQNDGPVLSPMKSKLAHIPKKK